MGGIAPLRNHERNDISKNGKSNEMDKRKIADLNALAYVDAAKLKPNEDPYARNAYNQKESDGIAVDREVPDVRDGK